MRLIPLLMIVGLPGLLQAAPTWQIISSEPGKRIEIDRTSLKREEGGKVVALGRVLLEKELVDIRSGSNYRIIEALTRYDCFGRTAATLKRAYKKGEEELVREEEISGSVLPVRSGTLDDKVLREVCRPVDAKPDAQETVKKAGEAADKLRAANEALVQQERSRPQNNKGAKAGSKSGAIGLVQLKKTPGKTEPDHAATAKHAAPHWSYYGEGGPEHWHKLDPSFKTCATGRRQSPIDIRDGIRVDLEPIQFKYASTQFIAVDNGHTVQVTPAGGGLSLAGKSYELQQLHFHLPSEEMIDGKRFEMVAHLVHKAADGQLAVVAVLFEAGPENPAIQSLWNYLPLEKHQPVSSPSAVVNLEALLPANRNYYTYMGSLTTPPCSEGVLWLVMQQPVQVSAEQLKVFARLYRNNVRPIQDAAGRLIKEGR